MLEQQDELSKHLSTQAPFTAEQGFVWMSCDTTAAARPHSVGRCWSLLLYASLGAKSSRQGFCGHVEAFEILSSSPSSLHMSDECKGDVFSHAGVWMCRNLRYCLDTTKIPIRNLDITWKLLVLG
jgi:hypothetical protein